MNDIIEEDIDINDLYEKIISQPVKPPCSYNLILEDIQTTNGVFEFCMEFFQKLCIRYWGNENGKVNIANMTAADLELIKRYYNSFNMEFMLKIVDRTSSDYTFYRRRHYEKDVNYTKLSDIYYVMNVGSMGYIVSFDYFNNRS
jgi:hypothetical protein